MKSDEVNKIIIQYANPGFIESGLIRVKGKTSRWIGQAGKFTYKVFFGMGPKGGFVKGFGGTLTLDIVVKSDGIKEIEDWGSWIFYPDYLDDFDIQDCVNICSKLRGGKIFDSLRDPVPQFLKIGKYQRSLYQYNFYEPNDVMLWSSWVSDKIEKIVHGINYKPIMVKDKLFH